MSEEQKVPTKEEIISFLAEQISVKTVQLELQKLNEQLAVSRMEEMKALAIIGQIQAGPQQRQPKGTEHVITQEDMDNNPEFAEEGIKVGDTVIIPDPSEFAEQVKKEDKKLKK